MSSFAHLRRAVCSYDMVHPHRAERCLDDPAKTETILDGLTSGTQHHGCHSVDGKDSGLTTGSGNGLRGGRDLPADRRSAGKNESCASAGIYDDLLRRNVEPRGMRLAWRFNRYIQFAAFPGQATSHGSRAPFSPGPPPQRDPPSLIFLPSYFS